MKSSEQQFILNETDMHNLYDLLHMMDWQTYKTLQLNEMHTWMEEFFIRLEKAVVPEIHESQ